MIIHPKYRIVQKRTSEVDNITHILYDARKKGGAEVKYLGAF